MISKWKKNSQENIHSLADEHEGERPELVPHEHKHVKSILIALAATIVLGFGFSQLTGGYAAEGTEEEVVANRVSSETFAGEVFFEDEANAGIEARDFEVALGDSGGEAKMLIWDFNSEDLDEVQIIVNGQMIKEKLILTNNAAAISVPVPSTVTIRGVKDSGGGISYAVKFPNSKAAYFNVVGVGAGNTYTVKPL